MTVHGSQASRTDTGLQTISVMIPTKNRPDDLRRTLESLFQQTRMPDELVIVDQSAVPSVDPDALPFPVIYIHDPRISGLTQARNVAMDQVHGDVWAFLDDDVILEPDYLEQLLAAYSPDVAGVSGLVTNYAQPGTMRRLFEALFVRGAFHDDRQPIYWRAASLPSAGPLQVKQFTGAMMSFRAAAVRNLRFDLNLTGGSLAEDIDFCARLPRGSKLVIAPKARLIHNRSVVGRPTDHWLDAHAQSSSYMRNRNWNRGWADDLAFAWLQVGYALMATIGMTKRLSMEPFRAWKRGASRGRKLGSTPSPWVGSSPLNGTAAVQQDRV